MSLRLRLLPLALLALAPAAARGDDPAPSPPAPIEASDVTADTTWSGEVNLFRRVRVAEGATLRIAAGTTVVAVGGGSSGSSPAPIPGTTPGVEVAGTLVAEGDPARPIRFTATAAEPGKPDGVDRYPWLGIVVRPGGGKPSRFLHCVFRGAQAALQPGRSDVVVEDCVFHRCRIGIGVGVLWENESVRIEQVRDVAPTVLLSRFVSCGVGVSVESRARPALTRCRFEECALGVGNERRGITVPIVGPGPFLDRCEFLGCRLAASGCSRVTNSVFEGNEEVFAPSDTMTDFVAGVDRFVRSANLYARNLVLVRADVPTGEGAVHRETKRHGPLVPPPPEDALLSSLEFRLGLSSSSPGVGAATDGGDLGVFGALGSVRPQDGGDEHKNGLAVPRWLFLGPRRDRDLWDELPIVATRVASAPPAPGDGDEFGRWAVLDGRGLVDSLESRRLAATLPWPRVLLAEFVSESERPFEVRLGWDGVLWSWWNGGILSHAHGARRWIADDARVVVTCRKGVNVLLVRHSPRTTTGRLTATLSLPGEDAPPPGVTLTSFGSPNAAAGTKPIATAVHAKERGRDGKSTGKAFVTLTLAAPVDWRDASDITRYALADSKGRTFDLAGAEVRLPPDPKTIVLALPRPIPGGTWTLTLRDWRHAAGPAFPPERLSIRLSVL